MAEAAGQGAPRAARKRGRRWLVATVAMVLLALVGGAAWLFRPLPLPAAPALASLNGDAAEGAYLAIAGNCRTCHTRAGGTAYAGGLAFRTDFGTIYSTNITADPVHGIGAWSFEAFHSAMRHGVRADGELLYPAFPYTYFAGLTDDDIASLYLHLKTIPASAQPARSNAMDFPFGQRWLMHFWNRLFHLPARYAPDPALSDEANRGGYLVETIAHCGACHTPRNALGGEDRDAALTGGTYLDRVLTGGYRKWTAVDLTPSSRGLGSWSQADFAAYLERGINPHAVVHGPMREVVMDSTAKLKKSDIAAMATYLKSLPPSPEGIDWPLIGSSYDHGETVYTVHCGTCHLADGKGTPTLGIPLAGSAIVQADDPASLINTVLYGPQLPPPPFAVSRTKMKPFGKRLSDEDIAAVATYVRNSFGNEAGAVTANDVREQR